MPWVHNTKSGRIVLTEFKDRKRAIVQVGGEFEAHELQKIIDALDKLRSRLLEATPCS